MPRIHSRNAFLSEHVEQVRSVSWFRKSFKDQIIAIPNGGGRSKSEGGKLKAEGVTAGVHDLFVPSWLLWVEMKRADGGTGMSAPQKKWAKYVKSIGHSWLLCNGFDEFKAKVSGFYESM